jgi:hypothetical protein
VHQWVVGGLVAPALLWTVVVWVRQLLAVLTGCGNGLGNPALTGRLTWDSCVLSEGRPVLELPWHEDAWITALLVASLGCVLAALLVPRRSRWSVGLADVALPTLFLVGVLMGIRGMRRGDDAELYRYVVPVTEDVGYGAVPGGRQLSVFGETVTIPDVGAAPLGIGLLAGLGLLALVVLLLRDQRRPHAA